MYEYRVVDIAKVIDGDTYDFDLDVGFYSRLRVRIRLAGINTYEIYGKNAHELGPPARDFAAQTLARWLDNNRLAVKTYRLNLDTPVSDGGFGRWAGDVYNFYDGRHLSDLLRNAGYDKDRVPE